MLWFAVALAGRGLGDPAGDLCDSERLAGLVGVPDGELFEAVRHACPGLSPEMLAWLDAMERGEASTFASKVCRRAKKDLKRPVGPGFEAKLSGIAAACDAPPELAVVATGPEALLLGLEVSTRLAAQGVDDELALTIAARLAGRKVAGRYGAIARWADGFELPVGARVTAPLPLGVPLGVAGDGAALVVVGGESSAEGAADLVDQGAGDDGAWIAVRGTPFALSEHQPVVGVLVHPASKPVALQIEVRPEEVVVSLGAAGDVSTVPPEELSDALAEVRLTLIRAQEYGGDEAPPDRVWVMPAPGTTVSRLVDVLDAMHAETGDPLFDAVVLAREASLVEWPERVDAVGVR